MNRRRFLGTAAAGVTALTLSACAKRVDPRALMNLPWPEDKPKPDFGKKIVSENAVLFFYREEIEEDSSGNKPAKKEAPLKIIGAILPESVVRRPNQKPELLPTFVLFDQAYTFDEIETDFSRVMIVQEVHSIKDANEAATMIVKAKKDPNQPQNKLHEIPTSTTARAAVELELASLRKTVEELKVVSAFSPEALERILLKREAEMLKRIEETAQPRAQQSVLFKKLATRFGYC